MNKLILIFFIFTCFGQSFSQEKTETVTTKIQGSKALPLELNLILENLQIKNNEAQSSEQLSDFSSDLVETILRIDSYARSLSKEDIFLIGKIEIYKTLLKTKTLHPKATVDGRSTKTLQAAIKKANDPFISWFLQALLHDCESLLDSAAFKDYLLQKNAGPLEQLESKRIDKKVKLLYRWISKINPESVDFQDLLTAELRPVLIEALKNIEESFFLMASSTIFKSMPPIITSTSELKFFSLKKITKKIIAPVKKDKSVDDILAPITDENKAQQPPLPEPATEDWLSNENTPTNLKNLPKPSDDADWLQDF